MFAGYRRFLVNGIRHWRHRLVGRFQQEPAVERAPPAYPALTEAVEYAISLTNAYLTNRVPGGPECLAGRRILELGPGRDFTPALVMTGYGAQLTLADLYLEKWDAEYHPLFYRRVRQRIAETYPQWPLTAIDQVIERNDHWGGRLRTLRCGLERLAGVPDQSFDLTFSNAVFEHLYNVPQALRELYRVTKPGGTGSHRVDFRDHRDFERPLEFLCQADFIRTLDKGNTEHGNTLRPHEMEHIFLEVGFKVEEFYADMLADPAYLAEVRPRLLGRFRQFTDEQLRVISVRFRVVRPK